MKKFILKNGKEVKMGDKLIKYGVENTPLGKGFIMQEIIIDEKTLPELIKQGVISQLDCNHDKACSCDECKNAKPKVPMNIGFYVGKIAARLGWRIGKTSNYISNVALIYPTAVFSILLREIAIEMDKNYKDHIKNSPSIYVVSTLNGKINKVGKEAIKNYRNFAAFRSVDDAKIACTILDGFIKSLFNE